MREHRKGDRVQVEIVLDHLQLGAVSGSIHGVITSVLNNNEVEVRVEITTGLGRLQPRTLETPASSIKNQTIEEEEFDRLAGQRELERLEKAEWVPPHEVEYVLYDDEYMDVEEFLERLKGVVCDSLDENWIPDFVYVADKDPLTMIDVQSTIDERIEEWNSHFDNWIYPPEWSGICELDTAIKAFEVALEAFEKANENYWTFTCDHEKKVNVHALVQHYQDKIPH